ncbi:MAG: DNA replication protein DnaC [Candidatus Solibacter usitatus]|nr:DNA replication protein DnaC [Candidatus Solibacter usitatus]
MSFDPLAVAEPETKELYAHLLKALSKSVKFKEEKKKTCIHLVRTSAFAGVHARKKHLVITIKAPGPIASERVFKSEQVSKSRWHHELKLASRAEIDVELLCWLQQGYEIS